MVVSGDLVIVLVVVLLLLLLLTVPGPLYLDRLTTCTGHPFTRGIHRKAKLIIQ
jgi:hypothetical protein